jgi:hypothetical protein
MTGGGQRMNNDSLARKWCEGNEKISLSSSLLRRKNRQREPSGRIFCHYL